MESTSKATFPSGVLTKQVLSPLPAGGECQKLVPRGVPQGKGEEGYQENGGNTERRKETNV